METQPKQQMKNRYDKKDIQTVVRVAWPSALESFFVALAGIPRAK